MTTRLLNAAGAWATAKVRDRLGLPTLPCFKPEMEIWGDAADYRRGQGAGMSFQVNDDLAENGPRLFSKPANLWNPQNARQAV